MSRHEDPLKNFLKAYAPEPPSAPAHEFEEILKKAQNPASQSRTSARIGFSSAQVGLLAASLALAWVMMGSKFQTPPPSHSGIAVSTHSEEWAAELISSELSNDDDLPASQIGEDYLGLMADNVSRSK